MKLKENLVLRQIADTWVVVPVGTDALNFGGILSLNETGALLWSQIEQGKTIAQMAEAMTAEYEVSLDQAMCDAEEFVQMLQRAGCFA